ncbi:MAG TPA: hypothetical protein VD902_20880, partial [Symbiobacteriaceae bacterium]|nr:hypothetical protein [Symbiobacteriaceae bacterium]
MVRKLVAILSNLLLIAGMLLPAAGAFAAPGGGGGGSTPGAWSVESSGPTYQDGNTIWTYTISKDGSGPELSHFALRICPTGMEDITSDEGDPIIGKDGSIPGDPYVAKWEIEGLRTIEVTYPGYWVSGTHTWYVKAGSGYKSGSVDGPDVPGCDTVAGNFTVTKGVSDNPDATNPPASLTLEGGGTAYYVYRVKNTGNVPLDLTGSDDVLGSLTFDPSTVKPNETAIARESKEFPALAPGAPDDTETNTVTVNASYYTFDYGPKSAEAVVINRAPPPPDNLDFTITKLVNSTNDEATATSSITFAGTGGTAYYFYTVENTGDVSLTMSGTDDKLGSLTFSPATIAPGETATATKTK